jgi:NADH-quinone oxidoreductase subunit C
MSQKVLDALLKHHASAVERTGKQHGDEIAWIKRDQLVEVAKWLKTDPSMLFDAPVFVTAIDWLDWRPQGRLSTMGVPKDGGPFGPDEPMRKAWVEGDARFTVAYQLRSQTHRYRIRLEIELPETDPRLPSLAGLWPAFDWQERETFDMYGIKFDGHPDLRRIYLYEEFVGYPLRKDYPKEKRQPLVRRDDLPLNPIKAPGHGDR